MSLGRAGNLELGKSVHLGVPRNEEQLLTVLDSIGIKIESIHDDEIRVLCPFHGNSDTSAMSVSVPDGKFMCFNPMCDESGGLLDMVISLKRCNYFDAIRLIDNAHSGDSFKVSLRDKSKKEPLIIPDEKVSEWHSALLNSKEPIEYLHGRGIYDEAIEHFKIGYSPKAHLLVTPVFNESGQCVGGVGRGVEEKIFKNIPGTQTSKSLFNIHNAKKHSTVIVCESNFDAVRIHQAGFPGVVATLGGNFSDHHLQQMAYYFEKVIIFTDVDGRKIVANCRKCAKAGNRYCVGHDAGRDLGMKIATECGRAGLAVRWAHSGKYGILDPYEGLKDAGDMTDKQIQNCIENSVTHFEYMTNKGE